jgi:hypothetical protein
MVSKLSDFMASLSKSGYPVITKQASTLSNPCGTSKTRSKKRINVNELLFNVEEFKLFFQKVRVLRAYIHKVYINSVLLTSGYSNFLVLLNRWSKLTYITLPTGVKLKC